MIAQIWIAVFGLTASFLVYCRSERVRRWAPVLALIAQPAWYVSCYEAKQWGVMVLTVFYTALHFRGFWSLWIAPRVRPVLYIHENESANRRLPWQESEMEREFGSRH